MKLFTTSEDNHTGVPLTLDLIKGAIGPCDDLITQLDALKIGESSAMYDDMTFRRVE